MPYNPYDTDGISKEDWALIRVVQSLGGIVTSTTDHPTFAKSGNPSRHRMPGTDGLGLAVDAKDADTATPAGLLRLYNAVTERYGPLLHEAICAHAPTRIKGGREIPWTLATKAERELYADHKNHCHFSVNKGVILTALVPPTTEDDVPKEKDFVGGCGCWVPGCSGAFGVQYDGGVVSVGDHTGDHFAGSYFSLDEKDRNDPNRRFYDIVNVPERGYLILGTDGSFYGPRLP